MATLAEYPIISAPPISPPYEAYVRTATSQNGGIAGGTLRPGAIDQSQFYQMLTAQNQQQQKVTSAQSTNRGMTLDDYRKLAGTKSEEIPQATRVQSPASANNAVPVNDGIPTLSLEQFAALTGMELSQDAANPKDLPPNFATLARKNTTEIAPKVAPEPPVQAPNHLAAAQDLEEGNGPSDETSERDKKDSKVVLLETYPDREEQRSLAAQGKKWRMKDTPGARELFLGPDGKFGWDDFVDIINPLQHIPVVAQVYRAVTGDQAYALSNFIGALPFGPISVASAIVDTFIRSQTGRDSGTDLAAAVLGIDNRTPEEADLHLATRNTDQLASKTPETLTPDILEPSEPQTQIAALPTRESAWRRNDIGRD